ncbi:Uncharacterised protein [Mycobacteroides abscessus subsp. abscessus]|nr:Uncharacterised protein [Mycobacteroides abscessus subsp. abscessus]
MRPPTPEEIRAQYVETVARAQFDHFCKIATWEEIGESDRQTWIPNAEHAVDALAAAGLLPTRVERRELEDGWAGQLVSSSGEVTAVSKPCTRQQRYVTEWRVVEK